MKPDEQIAALTEQVSRLAAQVEALSRSPTPKAAREIAQAQWDRLWEETQAVAQNPDAVERAKLILAMDGPSVLATFQKMDIKTAYATLAAVKKPADRERLRSRLSGQFLAAIDAVPLPAPARVRITCADPQGFFESPGTGTKGSGTRLMGSAYMGASLGVAYKIMLKSQLDDLLKKDVVLADAIGRGIVLVEKISDEQSHGMLEMEILAMREDR